MFNLEKEKLEEKAKVDKINFEKQKNDVVLKYKKEIENLENEKNEEIEKLFTKIEEEETNCKELLEESANLESRINFLSNETSNLNSLLVESKNENSNLLLKYNDEVIVSNERSNEIKEKNIIINRLENLESRNLKTIKDLEMIITQEKNKNLNEMQELNDEKKKLLKRLDDQSKKINDLQNQLIKYQFSNQKTEALSSQQIEFLNNKIEELNKILVNNQEKYEKTLCKSFIYKII